MEFYSFLTDQSNTYSWWFLNETFLLLFQVCLFFDPYIMVEQWRRSGGLQCEESGGSFLEIYNTFSKLFIVVIHYTHINAC